MLGERYLQGNNGYFGYAECIAYQDDTNLAVRFDNTGYIATGVTASDFREGKVHDGNFVTIQL